MRSRFVQAVLFAGSLVVVTWSVAATAQPRTAGRAGRAFPLEQRLTTSQLSTALQRAARRTTLPSRLDPPLSAVGGARPFIFWNGCHLDHERTKSKPCVYGDRTSQTSVVLFGDSHAASWFPALDVISKQRRWRLIDLTKDGCPPAEVTIATHFDNGAEYVECSTWRRNAMDQIARLHPALVILTWARFLEVPEASPMPGVPTPYGDPWLDGVADTFRFLHHAATHVVFISDVPTLSQSVPQCIAAHRSDLTACDGTRHDAIALPRVKAEEIDLAHHDGIDVIDPTSWFCTATVCPVIVKNILIYHDRAHIMPAWARFLAPVLDRKIAPVPDHPSSAAAPR